MQRLLAVLEKHPNISFVIILALLFGVISLASLSRTPEEGVKETAQTFKTTRVFAVREAPFITATAKVKKSGVVDIVAVTSGTVQSVNVRIGQTVAPGTTLVTLTNDYGVNAAQLSAEKTRLESEFTERTYSLQEEINRRERKIADGNDTLTDREEKNAIDNLKIELERLRLNREMTRLDVTIANASDAILRPKSLVSGTVEFIGVRGGENISAGTLIATIRGKKSIDTLTASLPNGVARFINPNGVATLILNNERLTLSQGYVSQSENSLGLRTLTFPLSSEIASKLTESEFVSILLPLKNNGDQFFVPIDAILSHADGNSVIVLGENNTAVKKDIILGETIGSFVSVTSGLTSTDEVVLNRGVVPGETVERLQ